MKPYEQTYQILSTLGKGGMGSVYLARHNRLGTLWAMKQVDKKVGAQVDLLGEANMLKRLNHPSLPRIIDIFDDYDSIYIVEDYIEGVALDKRLDEVGRLPEAQVRKWAAQLCDVLRYLHEQQPHPVIYRDMKPANIMVTPGGDVKLIDFGIAREYKMESGGDTSYLGTRGYAAPEQFGTAQTDARTDIYSLGVTLYHLVTGVSPNDPPYVLKPIRKWDSSLSEGMEYIIEKCTQADPQQRYQSIAELQRDLRNIESFSAASRRRRTADAVKIVLCCVMVAAGAALMVLGQMRHSQEQAVIEAYAVQYEQGLEQIASGDLDGALLTLTAADDAANRSDGSAAVIMALMNAGRTAECVSLSEQAAAAHPELLENADVNYCWGVALIDQGDAAGALTRLKQAVELAPESKLYQRYLARCYALTGQMAEANAILTDLESSDGTGAGAFVQAGLLDAQGDYAGAAEAYGRCIEQGADDELRISAYRELAKLHKAQRAQNPDAVDAEIDTLLAMQRAYPGSEDAFVLEQLAQAYYARGTQNGSDDDLRLSVANFNTLLSLGYGRASTYLNIAVVQQRMGDFDAAEEMLELLLNRYPNNADAYIQMAFIAVERENMKGQNERDYGLVTTYYDKAVEYGGFGAAMQRLEGVISDLRAGGWL